MDQAQQQLIVNLLVKVGMMAGIAALLVRSARFKHLVFRDDRPVRENIEMGTYLGFLIAVISWAV